MDLATTCENKTYEGTALETERKGSAVLKLRPDLHQQIPFRQLFASAW